MCGNETVFFPPPETTIVYQTQSPFSFPQQSVSSEHHQPPGRDPRHYMMEAVPPSLVRIIATTGHHIPSFLKDPSGSQHGPETNGRAGFCTISREEHFLQALHYSGIHSPTRGDSSPKPFVIPVPARSIALRLELLRCPAAKCITWTVYL